MSAICGIIHLFDESEDIQKDLELMVQSMSHRGKDYSHIWLDFDVGLGQQLTFNTPESINEKLPFQHNHLTIVADARIDNREELLQTFNIHYKEYIDYPDSHLIIRAFEKWGADCPQHLIGDFAFAIWNKQEKNLFCCRDQMGVRPMFYYHDSKRFIFASEPKAILSVRGVETRINKNKLATFIIPASKSRFWSQSWFENVFSLSAGNYISFDRNRFRKHKYWTPVPTSIPYKSDDEILEAFKTLMFDAVGARLRSSFPHTATLSGGLDSSAIVSVAAKILDSQNKTLETFSAVLPGENDSTLSDERYFINQFRNFDNVRINFITASDYKIFDDAEKMVWLYDSPLIIPTNYLYKSFADAADGLNSRIILDGGGGELGASYHGEECYAEMFFKFRWLWVLRELNLRKKVDDHPFWRIFRSHIIKPLTPSFLLPQNKSNRIYSQYHPLKLNFADKLISEMPELRETKSHYNNFPPNHYRAMRNFQINSQNKSTGLNSMAGGKVDVCFPLLDKRILEFCLSVPTQLKVHNGYKRYLIRAGLDKFLPAEIQWRNTKGAFSPDYLRRYNAQRNEILEFLLDIKSDDPVSSVVDVKRLIELASLQVNENEAYTFAEIAARDLVPQGIFLIHFLRRFSVFRK